MINKTYTKFLVLLLCISMLSTNSVGFAYATDPVNEDSIEEIQDLEETTLEDEQQEIKGCEYYLSLDDEELENLSEEALVVLGNCYAESVNTLNEDDGIDPQDLDVHFPTRDEVIDRFNNPSKYLGEGSFEYGFKYEDHNGTRYYLIETAADLAYLSASIVYTSFKSEVVGGIYPAEDGYKGIHFRQKADISLEVYDNWIPIGVGGSYQGGDGTNYNYGFHPANDYRAFQGYYDGESHRVYNVKIKASEVNNFLTNPSNKIKADNSNNQTFSLGLFGRISNGSTDKALNLVGSREDNEARVTHLIVDNITIDLGTSEELSTIKKGLSFLVVGGLAGRCDQKISNVAVVNSTIDGSDNSKSITGSITESTVRLGGIVGDMRTYNAYIANSVSLNNTITYNNYANASKKDVINIGGAVGVIRRTNSWRTGTNVMSSGELPLYQCLTSGNKLTLHQYASASHANLDEVVGMYTPSDTQTTSAGYDFTTWTDNAQIKTIGKVENYIFANEIVKTIGGSAATSGDTCYDVGFNRTDSAHVNFELNRNPGTDSFDAVYSFVMDHHYVLDDGNANLLVGGLPTQVIQSLPTGYGMKIEQVKTSDNSIYKAATEINYNNPTSFTIYQTDFDQIINLILTNTQIETILNKFKTEDKVVIKQSKNLNKISPQIILTKKQDKTIIASIDPNTFSETLDKVNNAVFTWTVIHKGGSEEKSPITTNTFDYSSLASTDKVSCSLSFTYGESNFKTDTVKIGFGAQVYVNQMSGDDQNNGLTKDKAFSTLEKAIAEMEDGVDKENNIIYLVGDYKTVQAPVSALYGNVTENTSSNFPAAYVAFPELLGGNNAPNNLMSYETLYNQKHKNFTLTSADATSTITIDLQRNTSSSITGVYTNPRIDDQNKTFVSLTYGKSFNSAVVQMGDLLLDNIKIKTTANTSLHWYCNGYDLTVNNNVKFDIYNTASKGESNGILDWSGSGSYMDFSIYGGTLSGLPMSASIYKNNNNEYGIGPHKTQNIIINAGRFARILGGGRIGDSQRDYYRYWDKEANKWVYPYNDNFLYKKDAENKLIAPEVRYNRNTSASGINKYDFNTQGFTEVNSKYLHNVNISVNIDSNTHQDNKADVGLIVGGQTENIFYGNSTININGDTRVDTLVGASIGNDIKQFGNYSDKGVVYINGEKLSDADAIAYGVNGKTIKGADFKGNIVVNINDDSKAYYVSGGSLGRTTSSCTASDAHAAVRGESITINLNGGTVERDMYGGGAGGTVGTFAYVKKGTKTIVNGGREENYKAKDNEEVYVTNPTNVYINLNGGTVRGNVYGGGDGYYQYARYTNEKAGWLLGNTYVTLNGPTKEQLEENPNLKELVIEGNVYGGGKGVPYDEASKLNITYPNALKGLNDLAHTYGDTVVRVKSGTVNGSVYGGGQGTEDYLDSNIDRASTNGSMGQVTGFALVILGDYAVSNDSVDSHTIDYRIGFENDSNTGLVFGGGQLGNISSTTQLPGNSAVIIGNGHLYNDVYGGGQNANIITPNNGTNAEYFNLGSLVYLADGTIDGHVYGGAYAGNVEGNSKVVILGGFVDKDVYGGNNRAGTTNGTVVYIGSRNGLGTYVTGAVFGGGNGIDTLVNGTTRVRLGDRVVDRSLYNQISSDVTLNNISAFAKAKYSDRDEVEKDIFAYIAHLSKNMTTFNLPGDVEDSNIVHQAGLLLTQFRETGKGNDNVYISNRLYGGGMLGRVKEANVVLYDGHIIIDNSKHPYVEIGSSGGNYIYDEITDSYIETAPGKGTHNRHPLFVDEAAIFGGGCGLNVEGININEYIENNQFPANVEKTKVIIADNFDAAVNDNETGETIKGKEAIFGGGQLATTGLANDLIKDFLSGKKTLEDLTRNIVNGDKTTEVIVKDKAHPTDNIYGGGQGRLGKEFATVYGNTFVEVSDHAHVTTHAIYDPESETSVSLFGGGQNAPITGQTKVIIKGNAIVDRVYGGNQTSGSIIGHDYEKNSLSYNNRQLYGTKYKTSGQSSSGFAYKTYNTEVYVVERASVNEAFGGGFEADLTGNTYVYVNGDSVGSWQGTGIEGDTHKDDSAFYRYWKAMREFLETRGIDDEFTTREMFELIPILASCGIYGYNVQTLVDEYKKGNTAKIDLISKYDDMLKADVLEYFVLAYPDTSNDLYNPVFNLDENKAAHAPTANIYDLYGGGFASSVNKRVGEENTGNATVIVRGGAVFNVYGGGAGRKDDISTISFVNGANVFGESRVAVLPGSTVENVYGGANTFGTVNKARVTVGNMPSEALQNGDVRNHEGKNLLDGTGIETPTHVYIGTERIHVYGDVFGAGYGEYTCVTGETDVKINMPVLKETIAVDKSDINKFYQDEDLVIKGSNPSDLTEYAGKTYANAKIRLDNESEPKTGTVSFSKDNDNNITPIISYTENEETKNVNLDDYTTISVTIKNLDKLIDFAADSEMVEVKIKESGRDEINVSPYIGHTYSDSIIRVTKEDNLRETYRGTVSFNSLGNPSITVNTNSGTRDLDLTICAEVTATIRKLHDDDATHKQIQNILYDRVGFSEGTTVTSPATNQKPDLIVYEIPSSDNSETESGSGQTDLHIIWREMSSEYNSNRIDGSVYGGGNMGQVGTTALAAKTNVDILDGHISGSVFGGGSGAPVKGNIRSEKMGVVYGQCNVTISDGFIEKNVYGAGDQAITYAGNSSTINTKNNPDKNLSATYVKIYELDDSTSEAHSDGYAVVIKGSVFGGGNTTEGATHATTTTVYGATRVDIIGRQQVKKDENGWGLKDNSYKASTAIYLLGGVYGDGNLCLVNGQREINIDYFHYNWNNFDLLKTFYSIQRADVVNMIGSRIVLLGAADLVDINGTGELFSINRVGELNMMKNSTVKLSTIVNYLGGLTSDTKDGLGSTEQQANRNYIYKGNNGKNENGVNEIIFGSDTTKSENNGYTNRGGIISDLYSYRVNNINANGENYKEDYRNQYYDFKHANVPGIVPAEKKTGAVFDSFNVVCVANGKYLEIKKEDDTYGPVKGLFSLELLKAQPGEGGGFVYAEIGDNKSKINGKLGSTGDFICNTGFDPLPNNARPLATAYMNVEDNVGGYKNSDYTYYYWYILGKEYDFNVNLEGYIGSSKTDYEKDVEMFAYPEGYTYVLKSVEGNKLNSNSIYTQIEVTDENHQTDKFNTALLQDHFNSAVEADYDKYAIEVKAKVNGGDAEHIGYLTYDSSKGWGIRIPLYNRINDTDRLSLTDDLVITRDNGKTLSTTISNASITINEGGKTTIKVGDREYIYPDPSRIKADGIKFSIPFGDTTIEGTISNDENHRMSDNVLPVGTYPGTLTINWNQSTTLTYYDVKNYSSNGTNKTDYENATGVIYGLNEASSINEFDILNNLLYEVGNGVKSLEFEYILHKGKQVSRKLEEVPVKVVMEGYQKNSGGSLATADAYIYSNVYRYNFNTYTSIVLLYPSQSVNIKYGKVYSNFNGEDEVRITKNSAVTAQFVTSYVPLGYSNMQRVLTLVAQSKLYFINERNGLSITATRTDNGFDYITASSPGTYEISYNQANDSYSYTVNNHGDSIPLKLVYEETVETKTLPKGTIITLVAKITDEPSTYWYYEVTNNGGINYVSLSDFKSMTTGEKFDFAKASNGIYGDDYESGVIENFIFVVNFENVENVDWSAARTSMKVTETESTLGAYKFKLAHLYKLNGETADTFDQNMIDIMDYVKTVKKGNDTTYQRMIPLKTNPILINKANSPSDDLDGINKFDVTLNKDEITDHLITGNINIVETRELPSHENMFYNTQIYNGYGEYSGYDDREYSVKFELFKKDNPAALTFRPGTKVIVNDEEYTIEENQNYLILPVSHRGISEFAIETSRDIHDMPNEKSEDFTVKASLYSSHNPAYPYEITLDKRVKDDIDFNIPIDAEDALNINIDGYRIFNAGDTIKLNIKRNLSVIKEVSIETYKFDSSSQDYVHSTIIDHNSYDKYLSYQSETKNIKILDNAAKGTYRLHVKYDNKDEYVDFIVK